MQTAAPFLEAGEAAGTLHVGGCGHATLALRPLGRVAPVPREGAWSCAGQEGLANGCAISV